MALTVCVRRLTGLPGTHDRQVLPRKQGEFTVAKKQISVRPLGTLVISLQQLRITGHLVLQEALVDKNLQVSPNQVELDLKYQPPEGATGAWAEEDFGAPTQDSSELVIPNVGFQGLEPGAARLERQAVALGCSLARGLAQQDDEDNELELELELEDEPDVELSSVVFSSLKSRARGLSRRDPFQVPRAQDFQVGVTVLEAQKLVGVNINPYGCACWGAAPGHHYTGRDKCPFYNEYFLFEFHETRLHLQDLLLEITAFHSQTLPFVGFVKVTLSLRACGDLPPPPPPLGPGHSSDVEKYLLLPRRVPWARLRVRVYRAEGLPGLARALHDRCVLVDPYVRVSFLGQQGETSVRGEAAAPEWNEQLSFVELFPPLTRGLHLQLRDDAPLVDVALATHVLDLKQISHAGPAAGFNPTLGPAWVPLYGSPPTGGIRDGLQNLNEGLGQGLWFRGPLLVAVSMEVLEGRAEPEPLQAPQGSRLSKLMGKKKKARRGQTPARIQQHLDASASA